MTYGLSEFADLPKSFKKILIVSLLVKLVLAGVLPLTADEAYYWVWSHHMHLSFYDHPPFVAWLFWLTHPLEAVGGCCRFAGVLLGQLTLCVWLVLLKPLLDLGHLKAWLWLALLSPLIGAGSIIITPDIPMLFFWALGLLFFVRLMGRKDLPSALFYGVATGLGFASKYTMVLEPALLFLTITVSDDGRRIFAKTWYGIVLGILIGAFPVWLWNLMNGFASFRFQLEHGLGQTIWKPMWTYQYLLGQLGLIFPTILFWAVRGSRRAPVWLLATVWGQFIFFLFTSLRGPVEVNWPIAAYAGLFALATLAPGTRRAGWRITFAVWIVVLMGVFSLVVTRWRPHGELIKSREFFEFDVLRRAALDHNPVFARSYQMAAKLSFDLKKPIFKLAGMSRIDFFDYLTESTPTTSSFYLLAEKLDGLPDAILKRGYRVVSKEPVQGSDRFEVWEIKK